MDYNGFFRFSIIFFAVEKVGVAWIARWISSCVCRPALQWNRICPVPWMVAAPRAMSSCLVPGKDMPHTQQVKIGESMPVIASTTTGTRTPQRIPARS